MENYQLNMPTRGQLSDSDVCNARLPDMPYMLHNPMAEQHGWGTGLKELSWVAHRLIRGKRAVSDGEFAQSVWGMQIHGKSGTWNMASGTPNIYDFIYRIPQEEGQIRFWPMDAMARMSPFMHRRPNGYSGRSDYYVCDSNGNPRMCALIGGGLKQCLTNYNSKSCRYCEDKGETLECEIRGWNTHHKIWERVPLYVRDILGETYRDEWRYMYTRPQVATLEIPKSILRGGVPDFKVSFYFRNIIFFAQHQA